jgi:MauM/NapG family ferredoxin protein
VTALDQGLRPALLPVDPLAARAPWLMAGVLVGVLMLNLAAPRFWCRYLCPLGALLGVLARFALVQRRVGEDCKSCGLCARACPTGTIQEQRGYASDAAECTLCMDCQPACPRQAIGFKGNDLRQSLLRREYDPSRREALLALGGSLAGAWLVGQPWAAGSGVQVLQPPGGAQNNLLEKCIRCGACVRACPTGALQPALLEAGLEGVWSPQFIPRLGYCDYACNACGTVCPVEAIPRLSLADKRRQVIGVAEIDRQRCLAWSGQSACIICEEMCPVPDKAISLENTSVTSPGGESIIMQTPAVHPRRCIGCGICEYKCPVEGAAAIRVYPAGEFTRGMGAGEQQHGERRRRGQP